MSQRFTAGVLGLRKRNVDPLSGIPSLIDLRTHKGNKVPFGIASGANSPNSLWSGMVGSATQAVETKQFLTKFEGDGTPYLNADGVDDWMSIGNVGGQVTYTALIKSNTANWNSYYSICDHVSGADTDRWGLFESGSDHWHSNVWFPAGVRYNGVEAANTPTLFPCPDPAIWNVITVRTYAAPGTPIERGLMQMGQTYFGNARIIAFFIHDGDPTTEQIEAVEAYHETLKPSA